MDFLVRDHPGRSASRRHTRLARSWRRRRFGRRTPYYAVLIFALLVLLLSGLHLSSHWALLAGLMLGMLTMTVRLLPDAIMPGHIFNWQLGAWGEQMTAIELDKLARKQWVVRHDVRWGERWNHDHLVAGRAVFVLNTKNVKDSSVELEGQNLRVRSLDDPENSYLADRWVPRAAAEANHLEREMRRAVGFTVPIYPIIVIWGAFDLDQHNIGEVFILNGEVVANWIAQRGSDLVKPERRQQVMDYVRSMPRA
jgi:Nuclease-related domain